MLMHISWTLNNVLCLIAMILFVWMGSMLGYSKILETFQQFRVWQNSIKNGDIVDATQKLYDDSKPEDDN